MEREDFWSGGLKNFFGGSLKTFRGKGGIALDHKLDAAKVETAVEVDDIARAEGEIAAADGFGGEADVFGLSPTFLWDEAFGDEFVVLFLHATGHIGSHDTWTELDDLDAVGG